MNTYLIERHDSGIIDLVRARDAISAIRKVVATPRYEGALACNVTVRQRVVTHAEGGRA